MISFVYTTQKCSQQLTTIISSENYKFDLTGCKQPMVTSQLYLAKEVFLVQLDCRYLHWDVKLRVLHLLCNDRYCATPSTWREDKIKNELVLRNKVKCMHVVVKHNLASFKIIHRASTPIIIDIQEFTSTSTESTRCQNMEVCTSSWVQWLSQTPFLVAVDQSVVVN